MRIVVLAKPVPDATGQERLGPDGVQHGADVLGGVRVVAQRRTFSAARRAAACGWKRGGASYSCSSTKAW